MSRQPERWHHQRALCCAARNVSRWVIAICAAAPVVLAPAMAQTPQPSDAVGVISRIGLVAGNFYGTMQHDRIEPSRRTATDFLSEPLAIAAGEQLNAALHTAAATTQSVVIEPVARKAAQVLDRVELQKLYPAIAAVAGSVEDAVRRAIFAPSSEPADEVPGSLSWIATAADIPRPTPPLPNLTD